MILLKAHGGEIKVETKEGEGTTFIIQLPVSNAGIRCLTLLKCKTPSSHIIKTHGIYINRYVLCP